MGDFWQTTAQMYGSLFEKPKMLEKLLVKPPFKYIFDIITETAKVTGFGAGLYNPEEQNPESYNQKEAKILYLKKMIDLVQLMNKQELAVKPNKVVAGLEPENTNVFLQEVYKLAVSGTESSSYVKKVLSRYARMADENQEEKKEEKKPAPQPQKPSEEKKEEPKKPQPKPEEPKKKTEPQPAQPVKKKDSFDEAKKKEEPAPKKEEPPKKPAAKQPVQKENSKENAQETQNTTTTTSASANLRPGSASKKAGKIKSNVITQDQKSAKGEGTSGLIMDKKSIHDDEDMTVREDENPASFKGGSNFEGKGKFIKETMKEEKENLESETTTKKKEEDSGNTIKMGKIGLNKKKDDPSKNYYDAGTAGSAGKFDVEGIKKLVQSLCQNTNPLGKSLEFLNDDIDSMNKENEYWKKQYLASKQKYLAELKKSDEELQPLSDKLGELDEQIRDQKSRIQSIRAQIIRNTATIHNLLYSVVTNK